MNLETITRELELKAHNFVRNLLITNLPQSIVFHDIDHAEYVSEKAEFIGLQCGLNDNEINLVKICAWFHDTGFVIDPKNHEDESVKIAENFLLQNNISIEIINQIKKCILATKISEIPEDIYSKVLCDADLMHLTEDDYFDRISKMRKEWKNLLEKKISKRKFHKISLDFFEQHHFHTQYGKKELKPKKLKVYEELKTEFDKLESKNKKRKKEKKKKERTYSKGVESMLRNTARMQINLSSIADKKSNILISVNAIIISITTTLLVSKFEETPKIIWPTFIFLGFSLITIIFAILSTRPNISSGVFEKKDVNENKVNLLFFGNFYNMKLEEYEWALGELMKNEDRIYSAMIRDQYYLGKVLAKKYQMLRIAYNLFMFGIIISVFAFIIAFVNVQ